MKNTILHFQYLRPSAVVGLFDLAELEERFNGQIFAVLLI